MTRRLITLLVLILPLVFLSCSRDKSTNRASTSATPVGTDGEAARSEDDRPEFAPDWRSGEDRELVRVAVVPPTNKIQPDETFRLAFLFRMKPEWHIYWKNPGDAGAPTWIDVNVPSGFEVGEVEWPAPVTFETSGIRSFGYREETVLFLPVRAPEEVSGSSIPVSADVEYLACREKCIRGSVHLEEHIPVSGVKLADDMQKMIKEHRSSIPVPVMEAEGGQVEDDGESVRVSLPGGTKNTIQVFPVSVPGVEIGDIETNSGNGKSYVRIPYDVHPENQTGEKPLAVQGVVSTGEGKKRTAYSFSVSVGSN